MPSPADPLTFTHGPTWRNSMALAPMTNRQSHADGRLSDDEIDWLTARAEGQFGLVMTAAAFVAPAGHVWQGQLGVASADHMPGLRRLADALRAAGACSAVQLHHGGRRAEREITGRAAQCPWDDPDHDAVAMTVEDIEATVADFVAAAVRAEQAGFDGVELHGAHGYLLGQFMDTTRNHRDDAYGGSLDNRYRIVQQVLEGVRGATGESFQLGLRLSPEGFGIPLSDGREYARRALDSGLSDYLELSLWDVFMKPRRGGEGLLIDHFVDLPRGSARLGVAGRVLSTTSRPARWPMRRSGRGRCRCRQTSCGRSGSARRSSTTCARPSPTSSRGEGSGLTGFGRHDRDHRDPNHEHDHGDHPEVGQNVHP